MFVPSEEGALAVNFGVATRPRTKIVATLGPASAGLIGELIEEGMSVARINFSHGKPEELREVLKQLAVAQKTLSLLLVVPGKPASPAKERPVPKAKPVPRVPRVPSRPEGRETPKPIKTLGA